MTQSANDFDFSGLNALFINTSLKPSSKTSHTDGVISISRQIMQKQGVSTELIRAADYDIAPGVQPDMTENGWDKDDWPIIYEKVQKAHILVLGSPIWLGQISSVCGRVIERLYAHSGQQNDKGQYVYYGKVGGCLITGNEDGIKACSMSILYSLQHLGYMIPPQADAGWIGEAGPGPSYLDEDSGGPANDFTNRNTTFMTWNLMHAASLLRDLGGFPAYGNQVNLWNEGVRFGFEKPKQDS